MKHRLLSLFALPGIAFAACSGQDTVSIGETAGSSLSDYAGNWDGYAEAYQFESGSDRIRLVLDNQGNGTLRIGDLPLFPPPTDPNIGYPQGPWDFRSNAVVSRLKPGFLYSLRQARIETNRIRIGADFRELYKSWCELQTPVVSDNLEGPDSLACALGDLAACERVQAQANAPKSYLCAHNWETNFAEPIGQNCYFTDPATRLPVPIDCLKMALCTGPPPCTCDASPTVCVCTATSCSIPPVAGDSPVQIDAALEGPRSSLVGTLTVNDGTRVTVRFTRQ